MIAAAAGVAVVLTATRGVGAGEEKEPVERVEAWEEIPAAEVDLPALGVSDLLREYDKTVAAGRELRSWEARCRVTSEMVIFQDPGVLSGLFGNAPKRSATTHSVLLRSSGQQWYCERRSGDWKDEKIEYRNYCDGQGVQTVDPSRKVMNARTCSEYAALMPESKPRPELPVGFPPFLEETREHHYPIPQSLPDVRGVLADPESKVLPWRTRVDGRACYVVERTTVAEQPVFASGEDLVNWLKQNPGRQIVQMVDPAAKPGAKRIEKTTVRLALDPASGFVPTRWATKQEVQFVDFPAPPSTTGEEILCTAFRKCGSQGFVAGRFQYTRYMMDPKGNQAIVGRQTVVLEEFQTDREYTADVFHFEPTEGFRVLDEARGIGYTVGDSEEKIAALLRAVAAKKAFYEALKKDPAPPLEGAAWLNGEPIRLDDVRGKKVELFFWSMGCGPCKHQLPMIQRQWESARNRDDPAAFISIHPYVDGDGLKELKDFLKKQHVTFPVMVDSREADNRAWGSTHARYHVYAAPSTVWIDEKGHVAHHSDEERGLVQEGDPWMKSLSEAGAGGDPEAQKDSPAEQDGK
ncbi:MAG: TlpA family protein disulfide reductase [Pirellulales bacterium]|nr:TlpA family protein disulfide reductase [Pirellulales bacterium]